MSSDLSRFQLLDDLAEEFAERIRRGKAPDLSEYVDRHPELEAEIRAAFPALQEIEAQYESDSEDFAVEHACEKLGEYEVLRLVGRGGMGIVYEAQQASLGRRVALKVLPRDALGSKRQLERFRREAHAAAQLNHPSIVPVYGVGEDEGVHYLAMQFIRGQSLDKVLAEIRRLEQPESAAAEDQSRGLSVLLQPTGPFDLSLPEMETPRAQSLTDHDRTPSGSSESPAKTGHYFRCIAQLMIQAADALGHAHREGVLHRDVKPSNLMLDFRGKLWVTDFGLAKFTSGSEPEPDITRTGDIVGTLRYMAPERFQGWADPRSDIYSLGLTIYELLCLRPAFDEADRTKLIRQVAQDTPIGLCKLNPRIPRNLETIVFKAIAKEPVQRYQSARELADDLRRFLEGKPIVAARASIQERVWLWCRRNPALAQMAALIVIMLMAGFATVTTLWLDAKYHRTQAEIQGQLAIRRAAAAEKARSSEEQARKQEEQARKDEAAQRLEAVRQARQARTAVDRLLATIAMEPELARRGLDKFRRNLLEKAIGFYEEFVKERPQDPELRAERVTTIRHLSEICMALGSPVRAAELNEEVITELTALKERSARQTLELGDRWDFKAKALALLGRDRESLDASQTALRLRRELDESLPDNPIVKGNLAASLVSAGEIMLAGERLQKAEELLVEALGYWNTLELLPPHRAQFVSSEARCHLALGRLHIMRRNRPEARRHAQTAVKLFESMPDTAPDFSGASAADAYKLIGLIHSHSGDFEAAEENYERALKLFVEFADLHQEIPYYQRQVVSTGYSLGFVAYRLDRTELAESRLIAARDSAAETLDRFPQAARFLLRTQAHCCNLLYGVYRRQQRKPEQLATLKQAIATHKRLTELTPEGLDGYVGLGGASGNLGNYYLRNGQPQEAVLVYEQAIGYLDKVIDLEPRHAEARRFRHNSLLGMIQAYSERNQFSLAIETAELALVDCNNPNDLRRLQLAIVEYLTKLHDFDAALRNVAAYQDAYANSDEALFQLAEKLGEVIQQLRNDGEATETGKTDQTRPLRTIGSEILLDLNKTGFFDDPDNAKKLTENPNLKLLQPKREIPPKESGS